ncbi:MAG: uridine diphosphate-N-acetylglucosamine-binding protein YvcK, partial [Acidimicrobiia bacterium]|nr:uridine diphosphate-N-acetylglucosamine-binding protein YvcK [Acidimicrobiia bacterium]
YAGSITALVAVGDDGGSSGRLTNALGIPPPGDVRRCLLALSANPSLITELFAHRFQEGDIADHSLGNLLLAGLYELTGDFARAVEMAGELLGAVGEVIPIANCPVTLEAIVDGARVTGQVTISARKGTIESLRTLPADVRPHPDALHALGMADQIVIGPGSLVTSLCAALIVPEVMDSVLNSPAVKTVVLNLVTQRGETEDLSGADQLDLLCRITGLLPPGIVVANNGSLSAPDDLEEVTISSVETGERGWRLVQGVMSPTGRPAHDAISLGKALERALDAS